MFPKLVFLYTFSPIVAYADDIDIVARSKESFKETLVELDKVAKKVRWQEDGRVLKLHLGQKCIACPTKFICKPNVC